MDETNKTVRAVTTEHIPMMALRGITVFPNMNIHFDVGREMSIRALDAAMSSGQPIFLVSQRELAEEKPGLDGLYSVGAISTVRQILRLQGDSVRVMVAGQGRGRLKSLVQTDPYYIAEVEALPEGKSAHHSARAEAQIRSVYETFELYCQLSPKMSPEAYIAILASDDPGYIADYIAQSIPMRNEDKQTILAEVRPLRRLEKMYRLLQREVEILSIEDDIQNKVR